MTGVVVEAAITSGSFVSINSDSVLIAVVVVLAADKLIVVVVPTADDDNTFAAEAALAVIFVNLHLSCLHGVASTSILSLSSNKNGNTL